MDPETLPLRDIHLPATIGWWPPAPGWWIVAILALGAMWWFIHRIVGRYRDVHAPVSAIRRRLQILRARIEKEPDTIRAAIDLSEFVRRVLLTLRPRDQVAAISGHAWLSYLDRDLGGEDFRNGPGQILIDLPYRRGARSADRKTIEECLKLVERWTTVVLAGATQTTR